jgi:hypothetical protein
MTKKTVIFCLVFTFSLFSASLLYADTAEVLPKGVFLGEIKTDLYFPVLGRQFGINLDFLNITASA